MWKVLFSFFTFLFTTTVWASSVFFDGKTLKEVSLHDVAASVQPGTVLIFGEQHGSKEHHQNQRELLVKLIQNSKLPAVSVGMEFIDYPQQGFVDQFLKQEISEEDFLKQVRWGAIPFHHYRFQVTVPPYRQGWTYGINLPRSITSKVSQKGLESLTQDEKSLLPPNFQLGNSNYFERFESTMKGHVPDSAIARYFVAQSLWDDTMAWQTVEQMKKQPDQAFVIIVGDFHAAWGHGLESRLKARGLSDTIVISQVHSAEEVKWHPQYGSRADFIFVSNKKPNATSAADDIFSSFR